MPRRKGTYSKPVSRRNVATETYWRVLYGLFDDLVERRRAHLALRGAGVAPARAKWPGWFPEKFKRARPSAGGGVG